MHLLSNFKNNIHDVLCNPRSLWRRDNTFAVLGSGCSAEGRRVCYSDLNSSIGFRREAFQAGENPKNKPMPTDTDTARMTISEVDPIVRTG